MSYLVIKELYTSISTLAQKLKVKGHSAAFTVASFVAVVKAGPYLTFLSIYVLTRL